MNDQQEGCGNPASGGEGGGAGGQNDALQTAAAGSAGVPGQGEMKAYDIPRYSSEGYVLGRPEAANDPTSAGHIQGAPDGGAATGAGNGAGVDYGQLPTGVGAADGQAMAPGGPVPQQGMPADVQGQGAPSGEAAGQGMGPVQAQSMAAGVNGRPVEMQAPPQGTGYMGVDPAYGQGQPAGMQVPPQWMGYMGADPAYAQAQAAAPGGPMPQPGYQVPPQGMGYMGVDPATAQAAYAQTAYAAGSYQQPGYQVPLQAAAAAPGEFDANQYGRIAEVVNDIANGEQPDMNKLIALLNSLDTQFWKGALIGTVATLLLTNKGVQSAISGTLGGIFGAFGKKPETPESEAAE
jgi:hypothetical protein